MRREKEHKKERNKMKRERKGKKGKKETEEQRVEEMVKSETFTIARPELRRILIAFGVGEKDIEAIFSALEKAHRHINVIGFVALLEKAGLDKEKQANVFRRFGMDDLTIQNVINVADEQKIIAETGRLFEVSVDF